MTASLFHELPTEDSNAGAIARRLARLQGPAVQAPDRSANAAELLALADSIDDARAQLDAIRDESFPDSATYLLTEWELALGLAVTAAGTAAERRAALLAVTRTRRGGTPQDLLALAQSVVPTATLREYTATEAGALGDERAVFTLRVVLGASAGDTELESRIRALLRPAMPAHVQLEFAATAYDVLLTEASEDLTTELGEELTLEM